MLRWNLSPLILALGLLFSQPAWAQAKVLVTPDALTVTGSRGEIALETRALTVRSTAPVANLRIYAFDLYNRDRDRVFPKRLITMPSTIAQINVDSLESFPVEFNLKEAPSGEFSGNILISYQGNELSVPVIVRVKDPWHLPFALLVFGVILGTTVSSYSRWGRTTDEITISLENLRTQFESDPALPPSFKSQIATHLADAKLQRDTKQLEAARQSVAEAKILWSKWFRQREEWIAVLNVGSSLQAELAKSSALQTLYIQTIQRGLKDTLLGVVDFPNPNKLGERINCLSQQQAGYHRVYHQFADFQQALNDFKSSKLEQSDGHELQILKDKAPSLKQHLLILSPSDQPEEPELKALENGITQAAQTFEQLKKRVEDTLPLDDFNLGEFKRGAGKSVEDETPANEPIPEAPIYPTAEIASIPADENPMLQVIAKLVPNPNYRLQLFSFAGYLTTIAFLAGTGFNQLYLERATFGADGLRDYFALLAWGFGAEATRSAVTNALRKTDASKS